MDQTPQNGPHLTVVSDRIPGTTLPRGRHSKGGSGGPKDPITGLTRKQEIFAKLVAEGSTLAAAYREAYEAQNMKPNTIFRSASLLMDKPQIAARVKALVREQEERDQHDAARIRRFVIERLHIEAENADNASARIRALELLGKLSDVGAFVERVETDIKDVRTAAEIETELRDQLVSLLGPRTEG